MDEHLTDLAALEWARFEETRLARESAAEVASHLEACAACREKVVAFDRLERSVHPYGDAPPEDSRPLVFRRLLLAALAAAVCLVLLWLLFLR